MSVQPVSRAAAAHEPYELVLLDHHMPLMDGLELAQTIREDVSLGRPAMIMLSSHDAPMSAEDMAAYGIVACDLKPIALSRLRKLILRALGGSLTTLPSAPPAPGSPVPHLEHGPRVLVAEDNAVNQKVALRFLRAAGYAADIVGNGHEAIAAVRTGDYRLVFMDVQMPEMDGIEATQHIRKAQAAGETGFAREIRIVAMTANAMSGDRELCLAAGMDDYLAKPLTPSSLRTILDRYRGADATALERST